MRGLIILTFSETEIICSNLNPQREII